MPADDVVSLLGLCLRSGKFTKGDALIPSIQSGKAKAVVMSSLCGSNRVKKLKNKCASYEVPLYILDAARYDRLGPKAGNSIAIVDEGFAKSLSQRMDPIDNPPAVYEPKNPDTDPDSASLSAS